ncbi:MAG: hypothetical protein K0S08_1698 [Gammaproteobacteria bacterium]|nr:hypothetical protein [Gammaproteobacteria bacterium]
MLAAVYFEDGVGFLLISFTKMLCLSVLANGLSQASACLEFIPQPDSQPPQAPGFLVRKKYRRIK